MARLVSMLDFYFYNEAAFRCVMAVAQNTLEKQKGPYFACCTFVLPGSSFFP
jgi:hypothetical protein